MNIPTNFKSLHLKLISETCEKKREFRFLKKVAKSIQVAHLSLLFLLKKLQFIFIEN